MKSTFPVRVGGGNMIKCLMDISIPEDSKCAKCCIYCEEKMLVNTSVMQLTNGKQKKKLKIIADNVVNKT